jgi:hypothetical protein
MKSIQNRVTIRLASDDTHEIDMNDKNMLSDYHKQTMVTRKYLMLVV